jgi:hypothetical protein
MASARGQTTCLTIPKQELLSSTADLEKLPLPLTTVACDVQVHGTTITLSRLHQHLAFPNSECLKQLLMLDYGRETDFTILVNNQPLGVADISGQSFTREDDLPDVGSQAALQNHRGKAAHQERRRRHSRWGDHC